jgi:hypothetical protein
MIKDKMASGEVAPTAIWYGRTDAHGRNNCRLARVIAVKPGAQARPAARLRGLTARRGHADGLHAVNAEICVVGNYAAAEACGTRAGSNGLPELSMAQATASRRLATDRSAWPCGWPRRRSAA